MLTEKTITHGDILVQAIPIGGFRMIDGNEADDKIIAVLQEDAVYGGWNDLKASAPISAIERLRHYFLTYKDAPGGSDPKVEITHIYGRLARLIGQAGLDDDRGPVRAALGAAVAPRLRKLPS